MEHLTDKELLELLEQPDRWQEGLLQHLEQCERCRRRWQGLEATWEAMGAWQGETPEIDLTNRILGRIDRAGTVSLWQPRAWMRIAASIIVGVGFVALVGRLGPAPVPAEQVSQAMYLDTLALNSSTGWTAPLLGESQEP